MNVAALCALAPVIPVLTIEKLEHAVPLARALVKGGLPALEITLRTPVAIEALRLIAKDVPKAIVGAGTVLNAHQLGDARKAGARFIVSPGCTPALAAAVRQTGLPYLPGVQTVSEAMAASEQGFSILKFFPAGAAGGLNWLKSVGAPLAGMRFCPTGGIGADTAADYLALPNVACVGGSWVAPWKAVAGVDWTAIEHLAAAAARLKRG